MTLLIDQDGAAVSNSATISDSPAVRITGDLVEFTNAAGGALRSTAAGTAAIVIEGEGVKVVNLAGGTIQGLASGNLAILGSAFADSVENGGSLYGRVELGEGNDRFKMLGGPSSYTVDLGAGDDVYEHAGGTFMPTLIGGAGADTLVLSNADAYLYGTSATGFERLEVRNHVNHTYNLQYFSGYQSIALEPGGYYNFIDSLNPTVAMAFTGSTSLIVGPRSSFASVTGSEGADGVEVNHGTVASDVRLGGGDDVFWLDWNDNFPSGPSIGGVVEGGAGNDILILAVGGGRTVDLAAYSGFETLDGGTWTSFTSNVRVVNASGFTKIQAETDTGIFTLAQSSLPDASLFLSFGGTAVLEATATIKQVGAPNEFTTGATQGVAGWGVTLTNGGAILGDVHLGLGDDTYVVVSGGATGGSVYGYAGDDRMSGGAGSDRLYGGYGKDDLSGNGGSDQLFGGDGNDVLDGGAGQDVLTGGAGADLYAVDDAGDVVVESASDPERDTVGTTLAAYTLPDNVENLVGQSSEGQQLTGNGLINVIVGAFADDRLSGGGGDDVLQGRDGDDLLEGGTGADQLIGGEGDDVYVVDDLGDSVEEKPDEGADEVRTALAAYTLTGNVETLTGQSSGAQHLTGNGLANLIVGAGGGDVIDGGLGADTMRGGLGNDTYEVDDIGDQVIELAGEGTDTVRTALGSQAAIYALAANVENLVGTSNAGQTVAGNALDNVMTMGSGNDVLDLSSGGNDTANGGGGNDYVYFGAAFTADDRIVGGAGNDTVGLLGNYNLTLGANTLSGVETFSLLSGTAAGGTEHVTYSITTVDANVPAGGRLTVYAGGLLADESLFFNGYAETDGALSVYGGAGNDTFAGGPANDAFVGGAGNDLMYGLGGNDWLEGGLGADGMRGGLGNDVFVYQSAAESTAAATDHIFDFEDISDHISLTNVDANTNVGGDQAFTFIGGNAFSHTAGELRAYQSGSSWYVEGDVNGDGTADLVIQVDTFGGHAMVASDFYL